MKFKSIYFNRLKKKKKKVIYTIYLDICQKILFSTDNILLSKN